ncbi:uncharacterized protein F5147DRAFT_653569 [Suillus discolor]|uniref:Uncharacterized protein n=1 Tax=Suillus discolor TaxID=1912936 RepID=A0A9P7F4B4_9AGAM|nr:uncharacterized protein F5147DRAFT_653569 [Suillus discolor]KAG2106975.1 hypothetical protein F5147DRAFT_653569 [Suillus discolor]
MSTFKMSHQIRTLRGAQDTSHPHPLTDDKLPTAEIPSDCVNQGTSGESASKVLDTLSGMEETPTFILVHAELQGAHEASERVKTLGGHTLSVTSAANNAPASLAAADDVNTAYLQPLKIFDTAIEKIADVGAILLRW